MIAFLSGEVAAVLPPNTAYIDVAGVGYAVSMPQGDLGKLEVGKPARVLTYLSVSDNGLGLYGFLSDEEKAKLQGLPTSLDAALDALEEDHDYLTRGGVFPEALLKNFIAAKRKECAAMAAIPHPAEFEHYYNL